MAYNIKRPQHFYKMMGAIGAVFNLDIFSAVNAACWMPLDCCRARLEGTP